MSTVHCDSVRVTPSFGGGTVTHLCIPYRPAPAGRNAALVGTQYVFPRVKGSQQGTSSRFHHSRGYFSKTFSTMEAPDGQKGTSWALIKACYPIFLP